MGPKKRKKTKQHGNKKLSSSSSASDKKPPATAPLASVATSVPNHHQHPLTASMNSNQVNQETLFRFIEAGGKKCYELFQYLSSSTHWRKYGTLPPLTDEETAMLSHMYQLWLQHQHHHHQDEGQEEEEDDDEDDHEIEADMNSYHDISAHSDDEDDDEDHDDEDNESQEISVSVCVSTIKESLRSRTQYSDSFMTLLNQLDLLMKSPEPCRTQASNLLEFLMLPEFFERDINSLERMFESTEAHPGYISACSLALGLISESEHLISSSLPSYEAYNAKKPISPHEFFNSIALSYYLKSNVLSSQLSPSTNSRETHHQQHNVIACMLLGSLFLRGSVVDIPPTPSDGKPSTPHPTTPNYQAAFDYYKIAALGHNPIAEHKVGYFYDEGLPNGVCNVDIIEAVKWYSLAAELMPDSMHNLAKIYEDGRGGFAPDMTQAVTLYSVAAARGFPLSQVNLGRLFLLGEDGVTRDREAGKRLLTLAAESGDADAQMVVGMIHATPAFGCYDLALSEHWLRQSLAGGKLDAERLLIRVRQQMTQSTTTDPSSPPLPPSPSLEPNPQCAEEVDAPEPPPPLESLTPLVPISQNALAAKRRGDDFVYHGLLHAAVLEYSRAFELDRTKLSYFVDRLDALCILGHYEECLTDSSLLLLCVDSDGLEYLSPHLTRGQPSRKSKSHQNKRGLDSLKKKEVDFFRAGLLQSPATNSTTAPPPPRGGTEGEGEPTDMFLEKMRESQEAMNRLYDILVESLGCLFSSPNYPLQEPFSFSRLSNRSSSTGGSGMSSADTGGLLDSYNSLYDQTISSASSELWPFAFPSLSSSQGMSHDETFANGLASGSGDGCDEHRQQYQQVAEDYMFNLHQHHRDPMICRLLQDCMDWELKSTKSSAFLARLTSYDRYYTYAVIRSGGIPILLSVLSYPSQLRNSLPNLSVLDNDIPTIPSTSSTSGSHVDSGTSGDSGSGTTTPSVATSSKSLDVNTKKHILHEQLWLNCATILHNLSFSHMAKKVMHLLSATDGYLIMCNCLRLCREKILLLSFTTTPSASTSSSNLSLIFRKIALARTSTCLTQILLSSACLGKEDIWDELMSSDLLGGILAALECALIASQIESYQDRIHFLQHLQHISLPQNTTLTTKKLQILLTIRESCLEEGDRILMDTVHTLARLLKIAPSFVLTSASKLLMIPFQRILVAITSHPNHSDQIHESLKSATAFCLCKLLCARDPRNAEILQQTLSKDGLREVLLSRQYQHSNGHIETSSASADQTLKPGSQPNPIDTKPHQPIPLAPPPPPPPPAASQSKSSKQHGKKKNSK